MTDSPVSTITLSALRPELEKHLQQDAAHDWHHIARVWHHAQAIAATEAGVDYTILNAAVVLHDIGEKLPFHSNALVSNTDIAPFLAPFALSPAQLTAIVQAINEHSFSRGWPPSSLEAAILQDADRLDAIGAIGIGRTFAVGGAYQRPLYDGDGKVNTIQHFYDKLLKLRDQMNTAAGRRLADSRHAFMELFLDQFLAEWNVTEA